MAIVVRLLLGVLFLSSIQNVWGIYVDSPIRDISRRALQYNIPIKVAKFEKEIAEGVNVWSNAGFFPVIDLTGQWTDSRRNVKTTYQSGSSVEKNPSQSTNSSIQLSGQLILFNGGERFFKLSLEEQKIAQRHLQTRQIIEESLITLIRDYYEWLRLNEWMRVAEENDGIASQQLLRIKEKSKWGESSQLDYLKAKVDRENSRYELSKQKTLLNQVHRRIGVSLQLEEWESQEYLTQDIVFSDLLDKATIKSEAQQHNVGLLLVQNQYDQSEVEMKKSVSGLFPTVSLDANYQWAKSESDSSFIADSRSSGPAVSVVGQLNVFNGFRDFDQLKNLNTAIKVMELRRAEVESILNKNIEDLYDQYQLMRDKMNLDKQTLDVARQSYEQALSLFDLGQLTYLECREYQLSYNRVQYQYISNKYQTKQLEWELIRLSGNMVKYLIK